MMRGEVEDEEAEIDRKEIVRIVRGLKDRKTAGEDGIPNEIWKYGWEELVNSL